MKHYPMRTSAAALLAILLMAGCNDPLPPDDRPQVIITTTFISAPLDTVFLVESFDILGPDSNLMVVPPKPILFKFYEQNLYQETLYDKALISGKLEIWLTDLPELKRTIPITANYLLPTSAYDSKTGLLTLDPKTPLWFQVPWNLKEDNGRWIYHEMPYGYDFSKRVIVNGSTKQWNSFFRTFSQKMHVRASIQLFPLSSTFIGEQDFEFNIRAGIFYIWPD